MRRQIKVALDDLLVNHYHGQLINSEASFQALFWFSLAAKFDSKKRRTFLSPTVSVKVHGKPDRRYPDVVVCDVVKKQIIAVVELKYRPRREPDWKKDIKTFEWLLEREPGSVYVENSRHHEDADERYVLADDAIFVWAGVYRRKPGTDIRDVALSPQLASRFYSAHLPKMDGEGAVTYEWDVVTPRA